MPKESPNSPELKLVRQSNSWGEYKQAVLYRLDSLDKRQDRTEQEQAEFQSCVLKKLGDLRVEVAGIAGREKGRAGLWGGISGAAVAAATLIAAWIKGSSG